MYLHLKHCLCYRVSNVEPKVNCINMEIVRVGGSIVFADYLVRYS